MAYYSGFQRNAFQRNAFQIVGGTDTQESTGHGRYTYETPYQKLRKKEEQQAKIRKQKSDLEKLNSVLAEMERRKSLAAESKLLAKKQRIAELQALENEYLTEINRLLMVRAELTRRIKEDEGILIVLIAMKRRRLRAV